MKKTILFIAGMIAGITVFSQAPSSFKYQAVVRDNSGEPITEQAITVRVSLLKDSITGSSVYTETHSTTSDPFGMIHLDIGKGLPLMGLFDTIRWGSGSYFIGIEVDFYC